jgi:hypothetical protein
MEIVYDEVKKDIDNLEKKYGVSEAEDVLLTLAPLSKFEIGVSKLFFDKDVGVIRLNHNTVKKLRNYGEIQLKNEYFYIPHSTLASLYLKTAMFQNPEKNYTEMTKKIRRQLKNTDLGFSGKINRFVSEILQLYLLNKPDNLSEFSQLTRDPEGRTYWCEILQNKKTYCELIRQINEFETLSEIGKFMRGFLKPNEQIKILKDIDWNVLYTKFRDAQIWEIDEFISNTIYIYPSPEYRTYESMIYKIFVDNIDALKAKLKEADIKERVGFTVTLTMKDFNRIVFPIIKLLNLHTLIIYLRENLVKCEEEWEKLKKETAKIKIKSLFS